MGFADDNKVFMKLTRCVVIEHSKIVWLVNISYRVLILGKKLGENGVKVFDFRETMRFLYMVGSKVWVA